MYPTGVERAHRILDRKFKPGDKVVGKFVKLNDSSDVKRKIPKIVTGYSYDFGYPQVHWKDANGIEGCSMEKGLKKVGSRWIKALEEV